MIQKEIANSILLHAISKSKRLSGQKAFLDNRCIKVRFGEEKHMMESRRVCCGSYTDEKVDVYQCCPWIFMSD